MSISELELIIYGAGGLGREIASMAESGCKAGRDLPRWRVIGFVDDTPGMEGQIVHGIPCLGSLETVAAARQGQETFCHVAIGNNEARKDAAARIEGYGWQPASVVHHSAYLSWEVDLGAGSFIGPHTTISPSVKIGKYVLINTRASIGHHVELGEFSQVSLGASILGHAKLERGAMVGAHAVVISNVTVGAWSTVGVCTPALRNVKAGSTISLPLAQVLFQRNVLPDADSPS